MEYKLLRFAPNKEKVPPGIIKYIYSKNQSAVNVSASSTGRGNVANIFNGLTSYWESANISNSWYSINFPDYLLKINSLSMFSCYSYACPTGFNVYAISAAGQKELICEFNETTDARFRGQTGNLLCSSSTFYSSFLLEQTKISGSKNHVFSFYFFEFFGDLYIPNPPKYYPKSCEINYFRNFNFLIHVFIFLSAS